MTTITVELGAVQETLLMPLLGRAQETQQPNCVLCDPKAVEIVNSLNYDFSKWKNDSVALRGTAKRTVMMDEDIKQFLERYPSGTVVEIGCGLNTRFERLDNGTVRWFDLDLPDVIALRRKFFQDGARRTMIAGSVVDTEWMGAVKEAGGPWLFVSEAAMIYLDADHAKKAITQIAENFQPIWFCTDTATKRMRDTQGLQGPMSHLTVESYFRWAFEDPVEIEHWTDGKMKLISSKSFGESLGAFWHDYRVNAFACV